MVKKPNMMGIIHSIILLVDSWRESMAGGVLIFCMTHVETPTSTATR